MPTLPSFPILSGYDEETVALDVDVANKGQGAKQGSGVAEAQTTDIEILPMQVLVFRLKVVDIHSLNKKNL